jgi:hypothetical protein
MTTPLAVALGSGVSGLFSAYYWYRSAGSQPTTWRSRVSAPEIQEDFLWMMGALNRSARLNRRAALWTALTAILGALASVLSTAGSN